MATAMLPALMNTATGMTVIVNAILPVPMQWFDLCRSRMEYATKLAIT